jgi:hypothetical protein
VPANCLHFQQQRQQQWQLWPVPVHCLAYTFISNGSSNDNCGLCRRIACILISNGSSNGNCGLCWHIAYTFTSNGSSNGNCGLCGHIAYTFTSNGNSNANWGLLGISHICVVFVGPLCKHVTFTLSSSKML